LDAPAKKKDGVQRMRRTALTCDEKDDEVAVDVDLELMEIPLFSYPPWSSSYAWLEAENTVQAWNCLAKMSEGHEAFLPLLLPLILLTLLLLVAFTPSPLPIIAWCCSSGGQRCKRKLPTAAATAGPDARGDRH
jgi:hypothetical protein